MLSSMRPICCHLLCVSLLLFAVQARGAPPLADVHVHYKWSQEDVTTPQQAVATLREHDIALAVVIGTPADYALRLQALAPDIVIPVWSPYGTPGDWSSWAFDRQVPVRARKALASGSYRGIGELHLISGFAPAWNTPVISSLAEIAAEFDVPILLHTEISRPDYLLNLCRKHRQTRFLWAHAGAVLSPAQVRTVLAECSNVWVELAARDPWRFINNPITDEDGLLLPEWRALIDAFPGRFMVGSDTVWPVDKMDSWDTADTGWQEYARFIGFHRSWIDNLPAPLATRIRLTNAQQFFRQARDR